jgi:hypothetical protein
VKTPAVVWRARALHLLHVLAVLTLLAPAQVRAQEPSFHVVFGWGGQLIADRWSPLTVHIHAADEPLAGFIVVEFPQDLFQRARIMAPFAAAPNQTTASQVLVCMPEACDSLDITLVDERGRQIASASYRDIPGPRSQVLPPLQNFSSGQVVAVGRQAGGIVEAFRLGGAPAGDAQIPAPQLPTRRQVPTPPSASFDVPWSTVRTIGIAPADLPISPMAYDGLMMLVVSGDGAGEVGQSAVAAVGQWVLSGGHLVIIADGVGEGWRTWLPSAAAALVDSGPVERRAVRPGLAEVFGTLPAEQGRETPGPAAQMPSRLFRLTERGRQEAWRVRYPATEEASAEPHGVVAAGPVGLGYVTVLGFDPQRVSSVVSMRASAAVWRHVLDGEAAAFFIASGRMPVGRPLYIESAQQAINAALESVARLPVVGYTVFWVIGVAIALLALLLGPIDYLVLRRRGALQRSWLTALVWIALASVIAATAPRVVRSSPTQVSRLTVVDMVLSETGIAAGQATGLTGVYAGKAGVLTLEQVSPASWWSGTSVRHLYMNTSSRGRAPLPTLQQAAGGEFGSLRGNPARSMPMAQWTFRTLIDHGEQHLPLHVSVLPDPGSSSGRVIVRGLPEGSTVRDVLLRTGRNYYATTGLTVAGSPAEWSYSAETEVASGALQFHASEYGMVDSQGPLLRSALAIPGPDRRAVAVEARLASGRWAAVYLQIENWPPYPAVDQEAQHHHTVIARILVPVDALDLTNESPHESPIQSSESP